METATGFGEIETVPLKTEMATGRSTSGNLEKVIESKSSLMLPTEHLFGELGTILRKFSVNFPFVFSSCVLT